MNTIEAPAKLTLSLSVTGLRPDGYHLIDAEMVSLELCDTISISAASTTSISVDGPFADGVPTDSTNLMHRALALAGVSATIQLTKNIPHGGGLGGGSTDAAAVLRWCGWDDVIGAAAIGADVSFCLVGGRAHVSGIGEIVRAMTPQLRHFTLIIPPVHVSTPVVYRMWDEMGSPRGENGNDLEPAALRAVPELQTWFDRISAAAGTRPSLAGSGATWFIEGDFRGLQGDLPGARVVHTSTRTS